MFSPEGKPDNSAHGKCTGKVYTREQVKPWHVCYSKTELGYEDSGELDN